MKKSTKKTTAKKFENSDLSYMKDDKTLEKIEKYVDKKREKTSQKIIERKSKRPAVNHQEADIEMMISRIGSESNLKISEKKHHKTIAYVIYIIIIIIIIIFCAKYYFAGNMSQIVDIIR